MLVKNIKLLKGYIYSFSRVLVAVATSVALLLILINSLAYVDVWGSYGPLVGDLALVALPLATIYGIYILNEAAKVQILHRKQWSWFRFSIYIVFIALLIVSLTSDVFFVNIGCLALALLLALVYACLFLVHYRSTDKYLQRTFRYGAGTIGKKYDLLNYIAASENFRNGLLKLELPVQVVAVTGSMGEGKSTFWRMTAEGFDKRETLHTYISLTETNSKSDFSKLFSERWFLTLRERYAHLMPNSFTEESKLYAVLREDSNVFVRSLSAVILAFNKSILQTKNRVFDTLSESQYQDVTNYEASKAFNNLHAIAEKRWFVVVDELERAPIDEVYRLIEVVERFKQLAKEGIPIQVIFVLCFDSTHFNSMQLASAESEHSEKLSIVKQFLVDNSVKSIDIIQNIPVSSLDVKATFFMQKLKGIIPKDLYVQSGGDLKYAFLEEIIDEKSREFHPIGYVTADRSEYSFKNMFDYVVLKLAAEPTRASVRVIQQVEFFMHSFSRDENRWLGNVNISTFIAYQYIKITRPNLVRFVGASSVKIDPKLKAFFTSSNDIRASFKSNDSNEDRPLAERILEYTGVDVRGMDDVEINSMLEDLDVLLPVVSSYMKNGSDPYSNDMLKYKGTLSDPDILKWMLSYHVDELSDEGRYMEIFRKIHDVDVLEFSTASDLKDFSAFVRNRISYKEKTHEMNLHIAWLIYTFLKTNKKITDASTVDRGGSISNDLTYEFIFQLQNASYGYEASEQVQNNSLALFDDFMKDPSIKYESKLITFNAFLDSSGGGLEYVRTREELFEAKKGKRYFINLFDEMKKELLEKFSGKGRLTLYNQEANVFYVQYQLWDGTLDDNELELLRKVARKGPSSDPNALRILWEVYPYDTKWKNYKNYKDVRRLLHSNFGTMTPARRGMFVKLNEMIGFTKKNTAFRKEMQKDASLRDKVDFWTKVNFEGAYAKNDEVKLTHTADTVGAKIRAIRSR